jgi:hypothetical protein
MRGALRRQDERASAKTNRRALVIRGQESARVLAYRKLHALARNAGLDDDAYRDKLEAATGKRSAKDLTDAELDRALEMFHVKHSGALNQRSGSASKTTHPHTAKAKALWIAAWNLGLLESGDDRALDAFVKRQTGTDRLAWLTPADANSVTEALKAMCARSGFVVPADGLEARKTLLRAQWKRLGDLGQTAVKDDWGLDGWVSKAVAGRKESHTTLKRHQLDQAAILLGRWIRRAQGAKK